jgi:uncharacterized membrane protein
MESRLRIAGQAVHPVLVMFPLGLFSMAVLFDVGTLLGAPKVLGVLAYWNIIGGLLGGALVALATAIDLVFIRADAVVKRMGVWLALTHIGVLVLFAVILMVRMRTPDRTAGPVLFALEMLTLIGAAFAAWHGGELVNRRPSGIFARFGPGRSQPEAR